MDNKTSNFLEMRNITKVFPGVKALDNVNLTVKKGEIHAICGENGAGKSTLIKVLSGVHPKGTYEGDIVVEDRVVAFRNTRDAEHLGIVCIHQELALVPELSIAENIFLGNQPTKLGMIDWNRIFYEADQLIRRVGLGGQGGEKAAITANTKIKDLGIGQQQLIEIAKALSKNARLLILDEPTAALTEAEVAILLDMLQKLRQEGVTCIYISHKLDEVISLCDSATVFRDGQSVKYLSKEQLNKREIIMHMVGRDMKTLFPKEFVPQGEKLMSVENFSVYNPLLPGKKLISDISFDVYRGEVLGVSGLMGAGRTELFMALMGSFEGASTGKVVMEGREIRNRSPHDAIRNGIMIVTEDRKRNGLVLDMDIKANTVLASLNSIARYGFINTEKEIIEANRYMERLNTKAPSVEAKTKNLSGGNQQKVVISKALMTNPKVLIMDEPTRGIDVGAKYEIYKIINQLVAEGMAIIMISSELEEVIGMSDRVMVICQGKNQGILTREEISQNKIMELAIGEAKL